MSQGVGDYIRGLKEEAENKLPADKRKLANEKILQTLSAECAKVRPGNRLVFDFRTERDGGFACICGILHILMPCSFWLYSEGRYFFQCRRT